MMRDAWVSQALLPGGAEVTQRHHTGCWALQGVETRNTAPQTHFTVHLISQANNCISELQVVLTE